MITIRTLFAQINIDPNKEYVIYQVSYLADQFGRPLPEYSEEVKSGHFHEYGDIIIETERKRYTIPTVHSSGDWVCSLLCYIRSQKDTDNIFVDMLELGEKYNHIRAFECGEVFVETI